MASDPDFARVAGLRVRAYNLLIAVLAAVTVTVAMRTVGLLLVSALMVVPVATAQQLARSFRTTLAGAMVVGVLAALGGLLLSAALSFRATVAPGPTIVLLALAMFASTWPIGVWLRRRRRLMARRSPRSRQRPTRSPTSTRTSTAGTAATPPSPTRTTSTTSTTATGTPYTESTMTSTDRAGRRAPRGSAAPSRRPWPGSTTSAARRRSTT